MTTSRDELHFGRLSALRDKLAEWQVDGVLVGSKTNRQWLSGFTGSAGWVLISEDRALLATDFRYWNQAAREAPAFELVKAKGSSTVAWLSLLEFEKPVRIGVEARHMNIALFNELNQAEYINGISFVTLDRTVELLREVKSREELATIRAAAAITDRAMASVNQLAKPGMSESELAWELEKRMREMGATGLAFEIIVASGPNAAMAHHHPGSRVLEPGDPLIIDMGAELDDYASDLTRTFHMGKKPGARFREVYELVCRAHEAALAGISAEASGREIDALARNVISDAGYGEAFGHSLGHGVGLDVHEGPSLSQTYGDRPLPANSVVTVEPGIYLPDWGGVRIEDLILVTADGMEMLSQCPKTPIIAD